MTIVTLDDLVATSDVLVLCCPLTPETHHLVDRSVLDALPDGAWLVNVSRGPLVDEEALVAALEAGRLAGAALDVFETEPLPASSPLRGFGQVILGSHNGSNTEEAVARVNARVIELVIEELETMPR